ncbi:uncharacterized protein LOC110708999 [Chenopodium quinoa]|uniref:uncharacterized protein LOC110708999 n=1 Tax=Chenopodium quinoa TaxID=63459 RepID=UPI000B78240D|nr:uncharacterized protein LOC110708999 [Chenopodium quinoa]
MLVHLLHRRVLCMLVILASITSCLHTQVLGSRRGRYQLMERSAAVVDHATHQKQPQQEERVSNDEINVDNFKSRCSSNTTSSDFEGFVGNSKRVVPTGPDPLHNRDDQT